MKVFKILKVVFLVLALTLFLASFVLCGIRAGTTIDEDAEASTNESIAADTSFMAALTTYVGLFAMAAVGVLLMSANGDTAKRVGHGLTISSFAVGLAVALTFINAHSVAAVFMLIAAVLLVLQYICMFVIYVIKKNSPDAAEDPNEDVRVVRIREWKHIMEEGIISPEEYEEKRVQILGIKKPKEAHKSLD